MNPKDRMAMMIAGMDGTPDRQAPMPSEGDNYGYASSMAGLNDPEEVLRRARMKMLMGGASMAAAVPVGAMTGPMAPLATTGMLFGGGTAAAMGAHEAKLASGQMRGEHPYQYQMDDDLDAMRYYGHNSLRGPR